MRCFALTGRRFYLATSEDALHPRFAVQEAENNYVGQVAPLRLLSPLRMPDML